MDQSPNRVRIRLVEESDWEQVSVKDSEVSWRKTVPSEQAGGLSFQISRRFLLLIPTSFSAECLRQS